MNDDPTTGQITTTNPSKDRDLRAIGPPKNTTPIQATLNLGVHKQIEVDGIGMGVLSDGTPFLTMRGLARLCGIGHRPIFEISTEWYDEPPKARVANIKDLLRQRGLELEHPYLSIRQDNGTTIYAYSDAICLAILEYYAFDAGSNVKDVAQKNFRLLAGKALQDFIYTQVGYDPDSRVPDAWRQFHDRVSLTYDSVPKGYFGVFKEMSDMVVTLGQSGLHIDENFVPDISVGKAWSKHWVEQSLEAQYGQRITFEHNYPDYFPQASSNPQEPWCYPESALGEFRKFMREVYIGGGKFEKYIQGKVRQKQLSPSFAQLAIAAYSEEAGAGG